MWTVLITGGSGFIGSHIARSLVKAGYNVVIYDVVVNDNLIRDIRNDVVIVQGDVTDNVLLVETIKKYKVNAIMHYAALLSAAAERNPYQGFKVNFEGTWNVFNTAKELGIEAIIFASSAAVYGSNISEFVREDTYTIPETLYGISKQYGEMLGLWFYRRYNIGFAAFRYGSVIGPGRRDGGFSAYSTLIIQKAAQGEDYVVNVPEDACLPIIYIKDVANLAIVALENISRLKSRIYNVSGLTPSPTAREIADVVNKYVRNVRIEFRPDPLAVEVVKSWPKNMDCSRLERELNWKPKYSDLNLLVEDFINEVRANPEMFHV
ncbi:MAG: NAD(P)-dependent oxidoreductase [Candidatus Methanomethylicia archaeon]